MHLIQSHLDCTLNDSRCIVQRRKSLFHINFLSLSFKVAISIRAATAQKPQRTFCGHERRWKVENDSVLVRHTQKAQHISLPLSI